MSLQILVIFSFLVHFLCISDAYSKSRCAVVIFVNQSSNNAGNLQGLFVNKSSVSFSNDPSPFKVKHGLFIDAPGLFALESEQYPGLFLRRSNQTIVLQQQEQYSQDFKNDATFLMDHPEKNVSFTSLKLFTRRSWKLFSTPDEQGALLFGNHVGQMKKGPQLLVIAQPCSSEESNDEQPLLRMTTARPDELDPVFNEGSDSSFIDALNTKGEPQNITNEYNYEDYKVPEYITSSLLEDDKHDDDGNEEDLDDQIDHQTKAPIAKETITNFPDLMTDSELNDLENTLKEYQYGSKACKLLVAEDTSNRDSFDEEAELKDTITHPGEKKCKDQFPESCLEMAKKGHCLAFKSLMSSVCRKSCNLCDSLVDTGFTKCTKSCGVGQQMRMIKIHRREYLQTRRCNNHPCPIDGGYSTYGDFTECSSTCGEGIMFRRRTCTNPRPQFNGRSCKRLGPSIEVKKCNAAEPCPIKHHHHKEPTIQKLHKSPSHGGQNEIHIDGKHFNKEHVHLVLLKGKKVAKLRCKPRKGELRSLIENAKNKRFLIHSSSKTSKKSDIEEGHIIYNKEGLPIDTSETVVKALRSPYKIILSRKGPNKVKMMEECLEEGTGSLADHGSAIETDFSDHQMDYSQHSVAMLGKNKQVYSNPEEKSINDFDEYKYEKGNVVTPEVTSNQDGDREFDDDYSMPKGKLFDDSKDMDAFFNKMNAVKPKLNDQLEEEQNMESTYKMENPAESVQGMTMFDNDQTKSDGVDQAGFTVTTVPDSHPSIRSRSGNSGNSGNGDDNGYEVESVADS